MFAYACNAFTSFTELCKRTVSRAAQSWRSLRREQRKQHKAVVDLIGGIKKKTLNNSVTGSRVLRQRKTQGGLALKRLETKVTAATTKVRAANAASKAQTAVMQRDHKATKSQRAKDAARIKAANAAQLKAEKTSNAAKEALVKRETEAIERLVLKADSQLKTETKKFKSTSMAQDKIQATEKTERKAFAKFQKESSKKLNESLKRERQRHTRVMGPQNRRLEALKQKLKRLLAPVARPCFKSFEKPKRATRSAKAASPAAPTGAQCEITVTAPEKTVEQAPDADDVSQTSTVSYQEADSLSDSPCSSECSDASDCPELTLMPPDHVVFNGVVAADGGWDLKGELLVQGIYALNEQEKPVSDSIFECADVMDHFPQ